MAKLSLAVTAAGTLTAALGGLNAPLRAQCEFELTTHHAASNVGYVYGMTVFDDGTGPSLIVGGDFWSGIGGIPGPWEIAKWDAGGWTPLKYGYSYAKKFIVFDDQLYVAVYSQVYRWTGGSSQFGEDAWENVGSGLGYSVQDWVVFDDGNGPTIFAAANDKLFRFAGSTWTHAALFDGSVKALTVFDDGKGDGPALFAAGAFTDVNGVSANRVAREWRRGCLGAFGRGDKRRHHQRSDRTRVQWQIRVDSERQLQEGRGPRGGASRRLGW